MACGETSATRSDRSRQAQRDSILDHMPGYVAAHDRDGFYFCCFRTPAGMTVNQGYEALKRFRIAMCRRYAYVDGLEIERHRSLDIIVAVRGSGWHAHWSLERSDDASPHYSLMVAVYGYDVREFKADMEEAWGRAVASVLGVERAIGPRDIRIGRQLGVQTVLYASGRKRTRSSRFGAHNFGDVVAPGESLGTKWWDTMGAPCLAIVRSRPEYADGTVEELRARAVQLHRTRTRDRDIPDAFGHFRDEKGRWCFVVSGPWFGAAAQYLATGSLEALSEYRKVLLISRQRWRASMAGGPFEDAVSAFWLFDQPVVSATPARAVPAHGAVATR